jgi:hypothetical protein
VDRSADSKAARSGALASSHIDSNPNHDEETLMAGKIEIRKSREKFRFVVLNRNGEKLLQSGSTQAEHQAGRVFAGEAVSGAEILDATKPAAAAAKSSTRRPRMKR